jgi:hypothetical protein
MTPETSIWSDTRFFGSGTCFSLNGIYADTVPPDMKGTLHVSRMPEAPPDEDAKPKQIAPIVGPAKPAQKPAQKPMKATGQLTPATPKDKRLRVITKRDKATCDHMQGDQSTWKKDGTEAHGARRQRYQCAACLITGFMVDGVVTAITPVVKRVADIPADMPAFLAAIAESEGVTAAEMASESRKQPVVEARRSACLALKARNLTHQQIADALTLPRSTVAMLVRAR